MNSYFSLLPIFIIEEKRNNSGTIFPLIPLLKFLFLKKNNMMKKRTKSALFRSPLPPPFPQKKNSEEKTRTSSFFSFFSSFFTRENGENGERNQSPFLPCLLHFSSFKIPMEKWESLLLPLPFILLLRKINGM